MGVREQYVEGAAAKIFLHKREVSVKVSQREKRELKFQAYFYFSPFVSLDNAFKVKQDRKEEPTFTLYGI